MTIATFPTQRNTKLQAALSLADRGFMIFPVYSVASGRCACAKAAECENPGKHPIPAQGLKTATTDPKTIGRWWEYFPDANIGIRTGPESGLWVLDADRVAGRAALAHLEELFGDFPPTPAVATGGRGPHLYFLWPNQGQIPNAVRLGGLPLDVRGANGYVLAPPARICRGPTTPGKFLPTKSRSPRRRTGCSAWCETRSRCPPLPAPPGSAGKRAPSSCQGI